jgi:hypothetical protein
MKNYQLMKIILVLLAVLGCFLSTAGIAQDEIQTETFAIQENSSFLDKIDNQQYEEIHAPEGATLFRWDFSEKKEYSYNFNQKVTTQNLMNSFGPGGKDTVSAQNMTGNGILSYKSKGDKTARFVLENLIIKSEHSVEGSETSPKTMEMKSPPMIIQGVKEDGNLSIPSSSQTLLLKLLFPLPAQQMKVSETIQNEANMPFNAMGSLLYVKGHSKITLTKYVEINGQKCAKFTSDIDISKMDIPPEMEDKYVALARGKSVFYFDVDNRKFVSGKLALLMVMDIEAKSPKMKFSDDKEKSEEMTETIKMAMNSDNLITLSIIEK